MPEEESGCRVFRPKNETYFTFQVKWGKSSRKKNYKKKTSWPFQMDNHTCESDSLVSSRNAVDWLCESPHVFIYILLTSDWRIGFCIIRASHESPDTWQLDLASRLVRGSEQSLLRRGEEFWRHTAVHSVPYFVLISISLVAPFFTVLLQSAIKGSFNRHFFFPLGNSGGLFMVCLVLPGTTSPAAAAPTAAYRNGD